MKNIIHSRLPVLMVTISTALLFSACQPANENTNVAEKEAVASDQNTVADTPSMDAHAGHDMSDDTMTDMHQAYNESMTHMHDEMMAGMKYNDPDAAFAQGMLGHHIGAVDMAEIQLKYGADEEMLQLAQNVIDTQKVEIEQMQSWLASNPDATEPMTDTKAVQKAYADGMDAMHSEMRAAIADTNPDRAFARGMLSHHVGAVNMATVELKYGKNEEMRKLAQAIIDAQQPEIEQMQDWLAKNKEQKVNVSFEEYFKQIFFEVRQLQ